jgi:hypothetical protein
MTFLYSDLSVYKRVDEQLWGFTSGKPACPVALALQAISYQRCEWVSMFCAA